MQVQVLDALGLKGPQPVVQIALTTPSMNFGDILEVWGDCPTFERDVRIWCERLGKTLLSVAEDSGGKKIIQIQF